MNSVCEIKQIIWGTLDYEMELHVRNKVLRQPLGMNLYDEDLTKEKNLYHFGAFISGEIIGAIAITPESNTGAFIKQLAVYDDLQHKGYGRLLLSFAEEYLIKKGFEKLSLHSRVSAQGFYEKMGYFTISESFFEVGIPHIGMEKQFSER